VLLKSCRDRWKKRRRTATGGPKVTSQNLHTASTGFAGRTPQASPQLKAASAERFPRGQLSPALAPSLCGSEAALDRPAQEGYAIGSGLASRTHDPAALVSAADRAHRAGLAAREPRDMRVHRVLRCAGDELLIGVSARAARRAPAGPKAEPCAAPGGGGAQRSRLDPMNGSVRQCNNLFDLTCSAVLSNRSTSCAPLRRVLITTLGHSHGSVSRRPRGLPGDGQGDHAASLRTGARALVIRLIWPATRRCMPSSTAARIERSVRGPSVA
jgi:hypothetical protein